ncbi:MAG: FAD-dependent oxidoreductase [Desulfatitalea sp.]|nr:FAD-dependent oxidoreductase [Desulfatitalea sp.]NNJ99886.1 FAD-dependent oxidoreductase [Desulfatitalea sp.]
MTHYSVTVTSLSWLTRNTFEIRFNRPAGFEYRPGQKITFEDGGITRDYTLLGPEHRSELAVCVRHVAGGRFSPKLAAAQPGDRYRIGAAHGYFFFKSTDRRAVFVATGTGIAPFVAFARQGVRNFDLLHGVHTETQLYYADELAAAARRYMPCLGDFPDSPRWPLSFDGRVDGCLAQHLAPGAYDFYLCGRNEMIRDVTAFVDQRFKGGRVFTEAFF